MASKFSNPKKLNLKNLKKEKMRAGTYKYLDKNKKIIYSGVSKKVQHRLFANFYGRSDYAQIPQKAKIRKKTIYYQVKYTPIKNARKIEKKNHKKIKKRKR